MSEAQNTDIKAEYIEESLLPTTSSESRQSNLQSPTASTQEEDEAKKLTSNDKASDLPETDPQSDFKTNLISTSTRSLDVKDLTDTTASNMADGKNEARALRVLEIMNDFRALQVHITSFVTREDAAAPDAQSAYLPGYALLRTCHAEAQAILATQYNPGSLGIEPGRVPATEMQKATLQRIILDASTRRFQAHRIYLIAAAGVRWILARKEILAKNMPAGQRQQELKKIDVRLAQEKAAITDERVVTDLRNADIQKGYWLDEDPSLERMLAWIRRQR